MIKNPLVLVQARTVWVAGAGSLPDFNVAANVLEAAICHADVRLGLLNPTYHLSNPSGGAEWQLRCKATHMLRYELDEDTPVPGVAEVEIRL